MTKSTQAPLRMVPLKEITIGKTNPRKVFDEDAIIELTESVKQKGVIQPILLRPIGDTLELVCGERRYRASLAAEQVEIPAYIRELSDEEALELQITENLQRKDVHPMEEAYAFKQLLENHTIEETAARVGKKDYFVKQRMKLNELTADWQKVFYKNMITLTDALKIAVLPAKTQADMYEDFGIDQEDIDNKKVIHINEYQLRAFSGSLDKPPFDIADTTLDKKAGACVSCQFNSSVASLFPDASKNPTCSNITCYKNKCDINFERELKKAIEDPAVIFISANWSYIDDKKIVERLKKEGHNIITAYEYSDAGTQLEDIDDYNSWRDDNYPDDEDMPSETQIRNEYDEYVADMMKQIEATDKKIASGKYLKGFIVDGRGKGLYKHIELNKKAAGKEAKKSIEDGNPTIADIDAEITRVRDREKRAKELDGEKVHKQIIEAMKLDKNFHAAPDSFSPIDRIVMVFLIGEHVSYTSKDKIKKLTGIDFGSWGTKGEKLYQAIVDLTDDKLAFMVRTILFDKYNGNLPQNTGGYMLRKLAESIGSYGIDQMEADQKVKADKRSKKVDARIKELQDKKKELTAASKPAKKNSKSKATA